MGKKIIVYQVFTRLFGNTNNGNKENGTIAENGSGKMNYFTADVLKDIKNKGITHIWYTGIIRYATQTDYSEFGLPANHPAIVKGKAGSPYAITDYYDVAPDLAVDVAKRMSEFEKLVGRTHRAGLKMIIDFVPNHVARQYKSLNIPEGVSSLGEGDNPSLGFDPQNNFYYCPGCDFAPHFDLNAGQAEPYHENPAKATGNDCFCASPGINDWYETVKLNYGVDYYAGGVGHFDPIPSTWQKMLDIMRFWAGKNVDGFRCDMAEMVPAAFWKWALEQLKSEFPKIIIIGEVYNPSLYRTYLASGFDYLYDKVGMYDTLRAVTCGYAPAAAITGSWQTVDDIRDNMLYFLENHDEQRIASDFFAGDGFKGIPALAISLLLRQNPFMLYAGQQYGERGMDKEGFSGCDGRTTIFDYWSVGSLSRESKGELTDREKELDALYCKLMDIAQTEKAVEKGELFDLMYANPASSVFNPQSHYTFIRKYAKEMLLVAVNFGDVSSDIEVNIPQHAFDYLKIAEGAVTATDLMTGKEKELSLSSDKQVPFSIDAHGVVVYKIKLKK